MEEIKRIATNFALEFVEEKNLMEKNPLMAIAVVGVFADGFEYGYTFAGTKEEANIGIAGDKYLRGEDVTIENDSLLYLLLLSTYAVGAHKGFKERDKISLEKDQDGNIIGISTNKTEQQ